MSVTHTIYVATAVDSKSKDLTLNILKYIHTRLSIFTEMGISVKITKISNLDLQNTRIVDAMRKKGITSLPALTTSKNIYIGSTAIINLYEKNITTYSTMQRREKVADLDETNELEKFYADEMTPEKIAEDSQDTGIGASDNMMESYRNMMESRDKKPHANKMASITKTVSRPDNISSRSQPQPRSQAPDDDDAEIQKTMAALALDIDSSLRTRAHASGGGDSLEGDVDDPQDDLMERAFWNNHGESL